MATKQVNLEADFPTKTASEIIAENSKFIGAGSNGDMRATPAALLAAASGLTQTAIEAIIDQNLEKTYRISDVDLTAVGFRTVALRTGKTFLATKVVVWHKTITNWTVVPSFFAIGYSLTADVALNANDWKDDFSSVLGDPVSSFTLIDAANEPRVSTGFDVIYTELQAPAATATNLVAEVFVSGFEFDTP